MVAPLDAADARARMPACLGLALLCLLTFGASVTYDFVWDDGDLIADNPVVRGEAPITRAFTEDFWWAGGSDAFAHNLWRPLTLLYYRALGAGSGAPWVYHAGSIGLHAGVAVLLFLVVSTRLPARPALFAAALFAVHPLRVESVAWISGAGDLLCAALLLTSLLLLLGGGPPTRTRVGASVLAFGLALLAKEAAFVLPLFLSAHALLAVDAAERRAGFRRTVPYWGLGAVLFAVRGQILGTTGLTAATTLENVLTAPVLVATYLARMTLPVPHSVHSAMAPVTGAGDWRLWVALVSLATVGGLLLLTRRDWPRRLRLPLIWTVLFLAPVCVGRFSETIFAERYTYVPALGFSVALALALSAAWRAATAARARSGRLASSCAVLLVLALAGLSLARMPAWRSDAALYATMLRLNPGDATASFNLGLAAAGRGDYQEAERYFMRTLEARPDHSAAHNSLGNLALMRDDLSGAEAHYRAALRAGDNYQALFNLATVVERSRRCREAVELYRRFVAGAPPELAGAMERARGALGRLDRERRLGRCR